VKLPEKVRDILDDSAERFEPLGPRISPSGKIARTIADLDNSTNVEANHILEAIQYRPKVNS